MTREEGGKLVTEFIKSESLRKHSLAVEAAMRQYARYFGKDPDQWGLIGLIHDFDYERWPDPPEHTRKGAEILGQRGVDEHITHCVEAMQGVADQLGF